MTGMPARSGCVLSTANPNRRSGWAADTAGVSPLQLLSDEDGREQPIDGHPRASFQLGITRYRQSGGWHRH